MSNTYSIGDLMAMYYEREFASVEEAQLPVFSHRYKKAIKKSFAIFAGNEALYANSIITEKKKRPISISKRIVLAAIIIVFLAVSVGFVIAFVSDSFSGIVYKDNTYLFANNAENCPEMIEKEYVLSVVPEGYELHEISGTDRYSFAVYKKGNTELIFSQTVKSAFNPHINTEGYTIENISVNDCNAICVEFVQNDFTVSLVMWDNEYYILGLEGNFTKEEMIDLANINEIQGF